MFDKDWVDAYFEKGVDIANRRVFIGDIDETSADNAIKGLYLMETESKDKPCEIFISSYGGILYDTLALYDIMNTISCPIHTFGYGKIMSAAVVLIAAGEKGNRWISPHVSFMHHDWAAEMEGKGQELQGLIKHYEETCEQWLKLLEQHTDRDKRWWKMRSRKPADFYFTASEAIEWGVADSIWVEKS